MAAHSNLLIDLIITMPWYILLARSFVKIQNRQRFSKSKVLLLGGIYEIGADGFAGPFLGLLWGDYLILNPFYWILIMTISFWQFILVYSSLVLPPVLILNETPTPP
ncbi:MAG: hypothetical protein GF353_00900 [Candidatus Lokiarchaeota archaeon]|nr:hypothetical protein [Candidatus Lokiarchaeota archaeon]